MHTTHRLLLGQEHEGRALVSLDHQDVDGKVRLSVRAYGLGLLLCRVMRWDGPGSLMN